MRRIQQGRGVIGEAADVGERCSWGVPTCLMAFYNARARAYTHTHTHTPLCEVHIYIYLLTHGLFEFDGAQLRARVRGIRPDNGMYWCERVSYVSRPYVSICSNRWPLTRPLLFVCWTAVGVCTFSTQFKSQNSTARKESRGAHTWPLASQRAPFCRPEESLGGLEVGGPGEFPHSSRGHPGSK